jgi:hypothetical protein
MPRDYLSSLGEDIGIARMLEVDYPGRTFVVIPVGGRLDLPPGAPSTASFWNERFGWRLDGQAGLGPQSVLEIRRLLW